MTQRQKLFDLRTLPDIHTRAVRCVVTPRIVGTAYLRAYDYNNIERPKQKRRCYEVPIYHMILNAEGVSEEYFFQVIRFGVVVGLKGDYLFAMKPTEYTMIWQDQYMNGRGGWRFGDTDALIHDGSDQPKEEAWGAAGCIEITGLVDGKDAWTVFNQWVRELSDVPTDWPRINAHKLIEKNKSFKCLLQKVEKPQLKKVRCP